MGKNENYLLDMMKAFFAICVIAIHTKPIEGVENQVALSIYNLITSLAVPFFFTATGFLETRKVKENGVGYISSITKKYFRLYMFWNIVYFPITIWGFAYNYQGVAKTAVYWFRGLVLVGEQFCSWPLWYLLSIIYGTYIMRCVVKCKFDRKDIFFAALILFLIAFLLNHAGAISTVFGKLVAVTIGSGRILTGPCFMLLGMVIRDWTIENNKTAVLIGGGGDLYYQ